MISTDKTSEGWNGVTGYSSESLALSRSMLKSTCRKPDAEPLPKRSINNLPMQDVKMVMIKARYGEDMIKFLLPSSSGMAELVDNVTSRLNELKARAFSIKYLDDDNDWVLIASDEDLRICMAGLKSTAETTTIRMLIQPTATQSPSPFLFFV